jgi:Molybdopterin oxidoreductase Fe4S4 domain
MAEQKKTFCRVCEPACGLVATVEEGRLVALAADRAHPVLRPELISELGGDLFEGEQGVPSRARLGGTQSRVSVGR